MPHFSVMVIGANPKKQLAPFDEGIIVPLYVKYTKEQLIEKGKKEIENYKNEIYDEYLKDKKAYAERCKNPEHLNYLKNEFPIKLEWNDEQIYADEISCYKPRFVGKNGEVYSEGNPKARWDWYELGGHFDGLLQLKKGDFCNQALKGDIANIDEIKVFAILKNGKWYERGRMVWWGIVYDSKSEIEWAKERKQILQSVFDEELISIYDCHI